MREKEPQSNKKVLILGSNLPNREMIEYFTKRGRIEAHTVLSKPFDLTPNLLVLHEDLATALGKNIPNTPRMVIGHDRTGETAIRHLGGGAEDYYSDDINNFRLLEAKIVAITRRLPYEKHLGYSLGDISLDPVNLVLKVDGKQIHGVRAMNLRILEVLMRNAGKVVAKSSLSVAHRNLPGSTNSLKSHMTYLRRAIDKPGGPSHITTVREVGYKFELPEPEKTERT